MLKWHILEARLILAVFNDAFNVYFHVCYTTSLTRKVWKGTIATACVTTSQTAATASFSSFLHTAELGLTMFLLPLSIKTKKVGTWVFSGTMWRTSTLSIFYMLHDHDLQTVEWFNTGHLKLPIWAPKIIKHPWGCYFSLENTKRKAGCTAVIPQRQSRP